MRLEFSFGPRNIKVSIVPMKTPTGFSTGNVDVELTSAAARVSELGQWPPGQVSRKSGHVHYASKAEVYLDGTISENLARTLSLLLRGVKG